MKKEVTEFINAVVEEMVNKEKVEIEGKEIPSSLSQKELIDLFSRMGYQSQYDLEGKAYVVWKKCIPNREVEKNFYHDILWLEEEYYYYELVAPYNISSVPLPFDVIASVIERENLFWWFEDLKTVWIFEEEFRKEGFERGEYA